MLLLCVMKVPPCATLLVAAVETAESSTRAYEKPSDCNPAIHMLKASFESKKSLELAVQR